MRKTLLACKTDESLGEDLRVQVAGKEFTIPGFPKSVFPEEGGQGPAGRRKSVCGSVKLWDGQAVRVSGD